jgi:hypothetical protein
LISHFSEFESPKTCSWGACPFTLPLATPLFAGCGFTAHITSLSLHKFQDIVETFVWLESILNIKQMLQVKDEFS